MVNMWPMKFFHIFLSKQMCQNFGPKDQSDPMDVLWSKMTHDIFCVAGYRSFVQKILSNKICPNFLVWINISNSWPKNWTWSNGRVVTKDGRRNFTLRESRKRSYIFQMFHQISWNFEAKNEEWWQHIFIKVWKLVNLAPLPWIRLCISICSFWSLTPGFYAFLPARAAPRRMEIRGGFCVVTTMSRWVGAGRGEDASGERASNFSGFPAAAAATATTNAQLLQLCCSFFLGPSFFVGSGKVLADLKLSARRVFELTPREHSEATVVAITAFTDHFCPPPRRKIENRCYGVQW